MLFLLRPGRPARSYRRTLAGAASTVSDGRDPASAPAEVVTTMLCPLKIGCPQRFLPVHLLLRPLSGQGLYDPLHE